MPTKEEALAYKRYIENLLAGIANQKGISEKTRNKLINYYLERWKIVDEALKGLGIPLEGEDEDEEK
ncbi:MAG: hypothetical protein K6B45_04730 [Bacteroidaceae bacterium]|nr:hypothetical protein [Bacteroidaceae bacterium]